MITVILSAIIIISTIVGWCTISEGIRQWVESNIERKLNEEDNSFPRANHDEAVETAFITMATINVVVVGLVLPILVIFLEMYL